jgi:hypothetical protein
MFRKLVGAMLAATMVGGALPGIPARAQDGPMMAGPPVAVPGAVESGPGIALFPGRTVARVPAGCDCGDRHGVSRWYWHKTRCKRRLQEKLIGFPEEFVETTLGDSVYANGRTQVSNGEAARLVFYHYDFLDGSTELNHRGRDKLAVVMGTLPRTFAPIIVERTPREPGLDAGRRQVLLTRLASGPFPVPEQRVLVGPPIAHGLMGQEATLINNNRFNQVVQGASPAGAGVSSGATGFGFDASGLSGAASLGR